MPVETPRGLRTKVGMALGDLDKRRSERKKRMFESDLQRFVFITRVVVSQNSGMTVFVAGSERLVPIIVTGGPVILDWSPILDIRLQASSDAFLGCESLLQLSSLFAHEKGAFSELVDRIDKTLVVLVE
jgi:hypothetical protein